MFEVVPGYPVGDCRTITLDDSVDCDSTMDKIIKPWRSF